MIGLRFFILAKNNKLLLFIIFFFIINFIFCPYPTHSEIKSSINGSGLKIPRIVSLKNYDTNAGYLFLYDGLAQSLDKIKLTKNKKCLVCSV